MAEPTSGPSGALLVAALLVAAVGAAALVEPWQMIAARALQGLAAAMVFAPALALAGDLAREGASGTQLSVLTMAFGLGTALGPLASGFLIRYGYSIPFVFGGLLACLGIVLVYTQVQETIEGGGGLDFLIRDVRGTLARD